MSIPTCISCKFCVTPKGATFNESTCLAVNDPYNGQPWPIKTARLDTHNDFKLPCGFAGAMWQAKTS